MDDLQTLPKPKIKARKISSEVLKLAQNQGLHPVLAKIIAARTQPDNVALERLLTPKLKFLDHPLTMQDMEKASKRLAEAIINKEVIGLETDHDCDGQTSHAVLFYNLVHKFNHPKELVRSYIGHRLNEGYGLSAKVAQRILEDNPRPTLVITADNGSTDEARIALLKAQNIDVIVTDHHQLPIEGVPKSAYACLNPTRDDCQYADPCIAGCMVAWLLMAATRLELIARKVINDQLKITDSLDYVAVGTIADCVSMARSHNNRAIVHFGLKLINAGIKPCWRAVKPLVKTELTAQDLAFKIGPLLNSDGRLACAFGSVSFLLADDDISARQWVSHLQDQNHIRKTIQNETTKKGMEIAAQQCAEGRYSLCVFLETGHAGVHGISASRIKDAFGKPTVFLAPKLNETHLMTGSIRGIDGFNVGEAIRTIISKAPNLLLAGGGHTAAGGVTLRAQNLEQFVQLFEQCARQQLTSSDLGPVIWTDGELDCSYLNLDTISLIQSLEPFGREFEAPVFEIKARLTNLRTIGDGTHARVELNLGDQTMQGVWFGFAPTAQIGDLVHCAVSLCRNDFSSRVRCEFQIIWMNKI